MPKIDVPQSAKFKMRWVLAGLMFAFLASIGYFFNYHLVYAGIAEEVTFHSGDVQLAGILVRPDTPGPHPGVILFHGAGSNQPYTKWNYRIHTNVFLRQGFAVLSFTKRGAENSGIDYRTVTFQDLISDGVAAVNFLRSQPDINPDQIGLLGVSESGWFTPEIAQTAGDIAFIVNRVSPPLPWTTTVLYELENEAIEAGISEADIKEILALQARVYQFYIDAAVDESVANGPERDEINTELAEMQKRHEDFLASALLEYDSNVYTVLASKYAYDPYPFLTEIDVPMLYVMAGKDVNVPFDQSIALLEQLRDDFHKDITIEVYPDAGHDLVRWDWFPLEGFYVPGYLDLIGTWAVKQIK